MFKSISSIKKLIKQSNVKDRDTQYLIIESLSDNFDVTVVNLEDKSVKCIPYVDFEELLKENNFDICFGSTKRAGKSGIFYNNGVVGINKPAKGVDLFILTADVFSFSELIPVLTHKDDVFSVELEDYSDIVGTVVPVILMFYSAVNCKRKGELVARNNLNLPVVKCSIYSEFHCLDLTDPLDSCKNYYETDELVDAFMNEDAYGNAYFPRDGYGVIIKEFKGALKAKKHGYEYYAFEDVNYANYGDDDFDCEDAEYQSTFCKLKVDDIFCKEFAEKYLKAVRECQHVLIKKRVIKDLGDVYNEFVKLTLK